MNPVLLKPTGERSSQVVVMGVAVGEQSAAEYHAGKTALRPVVLAALADLRSRYDVVVCEGAGGAAEINLLEGDFANLPLAAAAGLPAIVVGDIERGGVFASLFGTWALLPPELQACVRGFVINRFRGDPSLLGDACARIGAAHGGAGAGRGPGRARHRHRRRGLAGAGLVGHLARRRGRRGRRRRRALPPGGQLRRPRPAAVRAGRGGALGALGVGPGAARPGRAAGVEEHPGRPGMVPFLGAGGGSGGVRGSGRGGVRGGTDGGDVYRRPRSATEGPPGSVDGLGWMGLRTTFESDKVLDRPSGVAGGERVAGYRIHHGRVSGEVEPWIVGDDGAVLGWQAGRFRATTLHGLFESDGFRAAVLSWASPAWVPSGLDFAAARTARFDRIADALESSLDLDRLFALIDPGFCARKATSQVPFRAKNGLGAADALGAVTDLVPHLRWRIGVPGDGDLAGRRPGHRPGPAGSRDQGDRRGPGQRCPPGPRLPVVAGVRLPGGGDDPGRVGRSRCRPRPVGARHGRRPGPEPAVVAPRRPRRRTRPRPR